MGILNDLKRLMYYTWAPYFPAVTAKAMIPHMNGTALLCRAANCFAAMGFLVAIATAASPDKKHCAPPLNAPEIAPELLAGALVLVVGGLFILTDRMRRQVRA